MNIKWFIAVLCLALIAIGVKVLFFNQSIFAKTDTNTAMSTSTSQSMVHFDLYIRGIAIPVPYVSVNTSSGENITAHPSGVVTFSPALHGQTLGNIVNGLGGKLTPSCFGPFCSSDGPFRFYINAHLYHGDPNAIPLANKEEILIVDGPQTPTHIPMSYQF